jgi:hypothetical protein
MLDLLPLILDVFKFEYSIAKDSSGQSIFSSMHFFKDILRSLNLIFVVFEQDGIYFYL